ncbi:hypothetical protein AALP_AAs62422U000100 [Arabis alpina]|uniref:GIY-YIG domain-containing protein n=1 Tax=Arabis alpina TaxID=50452 RepID=A0A087G1K7_ARAAL|nr:hypothetical protein AALP_AAs62422U000100 [Arabis alpina]
MVHISHSLYQPNPFKTYVGITTDFTRRLKQHNGEIRGGAKASSAGRSFSDDILILMKTFP